MANLLYDHTDGRIECGFYIQIAGVQQDGVCRRPHGGGCPAGIAGDGAYNRTLTPMSVQRERRFIWEAHDVYIEMSPFFQADHIDTPLLMYHGAQDNNTGTFLTQSERLIQALTGLGKTAVLYVYPFESHGPRCLETYLDLWARWLEVVLASGLAPGSPEDYEDELAQLRADGGRYPGLVRMVARRPEDSRDTYCC